MKSLYELYLEHTGKVSDKWKIYLTSYNDILLPFKNKKISMLEIGIQNGGSIELWDKYFHNAECFIGCDINEKCQILKYDNDKISIIIGDANKENVRDIILNKKNNFDIILDDGSHTSSDIIKTFFNYFPYLKNDGIFIFEDLHCSYWKEFEGGLYDPSSSISFFKELVDILNFEHWGIVKNRSEYLSLFSEKYNINIDESIFDEIHSIEFINSICVIKKKKKDFNILGCRVRAGSIASVVPEILDMPDENIIFSQVDNKWSSLSENPNNSYFEIHDENKTLKEEKEKLLNEFIYLRNELSQKVNDQEYVLNEVMQSTSWKMTLPIRKLGGYLKKIKMIIVVLPKLIQQGGGVKLSYIKAKKMFSIYGISGVKNEIKKRVLNQKGIGIVDISTITSFHHSDRLAYKHWILTKESVSSNVSKVFNKNPLISIIMPVYNVDEKYLREAINSVMHQDYQNWELCISDDNSPNERIKDVLREYKKLDPRIKIVYREKNGHISENSNSALEVATGEFIALMDHDDLLSKNALYEVVKVINDKENVDLIYSDEDKITHDGIRYDPHFKSDFNLDLIYSQNYISHLGVYKTDIVKNLGGFRKGFEGSQDYDLLLRYLNVINHGNIYHISKVLYHWRAIEGSTALNSEQKSYTTESGIKALDDYFNVLNIPALVEKGIENNTYKINWPLDTTKKVSIIIPTYNGYTITKQAIDSILKKTSYPNYEIIIVNNNSDDKKTLDYLKNIQENKIVRVIDYPFEFNYSAINNYAVKESSGDIIALLNNDVEVINKDWLSEMVSLASRSEIGCVGAKLYYPNNTIQHAGVICGIGGVAGHSHKHFDKSDSGYFSRLNLRQNLLAVTAACLVVRKDVFNKVNGLNEKDLKIAFNDVDFCLKVHSAGYLNVWTPYAELYHHESISRGFEDSPEKIERFNREIEYMRNTWSELLDNDKYYNNNLTKDHENFQIKLN